MDHHLLHFYYHVNNKLKILTKRKTITIYHSQNKNNRSTINMDKTKRKLTKG